jgi:hypothetical protein
MACSGSWCFLVKWKSPLQGTYIISWSTSALRFQPFFECLSGRWDIHETAWPLQQIPRFRSQHRIIRYSQHRISKPPEGPQFSAVLTWKCGLVMFSRHFFWTSDLMVKVTVASSQEPWRNSEIFCDTVPIPSPVDLKKKEPPIAIVASWRCMAAHVPWLGMKILKDQSCQPWKHPGGTI